MFRHFVFVVLVLLVTSGTEASHHESQSDKVVYSVYVPKLIRPGMELACTVSVISSPNPVAVASVFFSLDSNLELQSSAVLASGESAKLTLGTIPIGYSAETSFNLTIVGEDMVTHKRVIFNSTSEFKYVPKPFSIIIQTDKEIYRPGDTCYFRALCLSPELKPLDGSISIAVKDPKLNKGLWLGDKDLTVGLAGGSYNFSKQTTEGKWTIFVTYKGYTEKVKVSVRNYPQPLFDVEVQCPKYIDPTTEALTIKMKANYTNGQPVKGKSVLTVEMMHLTQRSFPPKIITIPNMKFEGEMSHTITKAQIRSQLGWTGESDMKIEVIGIVTEGLSKQINNDSKRIDVKRTHINLKVLSKPNVIKPGLSYQALVMVSTPDELPLLITDAMANQLIVEATYHYNTGEVEEPSLTDLALGLEQFNLPSLSRVPGVLRPRRPTSISELHVFEIPPQGLVPINFEVRKDKFDYVSMKLYTNTTKSLAIPENEFSVSRAQSPSDSHIQLLPIKDTLKGEIKVGKTIDMKIRMTEPIRKLNIMVLSRGEIHEEFQKFLNHSEMERKETSFNFIATQKMTPSCIVLVSYVRSDKEVVADYLNVNIDSDIRSKVSIKNITENGTLVDEVKPKTNVSINVETGTPYSYVGLVAVDHNTVVMKPKHNISNERVVDDLEKYLDVEEELLPHPLSFSYAKGALDVKELYEKIGMNILTNAFVYKHPESLFYPEISQKKPVEEFQTEMMKQTSPNPRIRALFPKTWLWEEARADKKGIATINGTTLEIMRDWEISAFALSKVDGLQISSPRRLKVLKKFFLSLEMPMKVTRNEIIIAQAHVFNYHEQPLDVKVSLDMNERMVNLLMPGDLSNSGPVRYVTIPAGGKIIVKFPLRMNIFGDIPIKIKAQSTSTLEIIKDESVRNVYVKPEGIEQCYSTSALIRRGASAPPQDLERFTIRFPENTVPGSRRVTVHTHGDLIAGVMNNFAKLLKTSNATGEPTMLTFTPGLIVSMYLNTIKKLEPKIKEQTVKQFLEGYQILMRYKKEDGSFNFFGKPEEHGSTWLTAFACKCLMLAERFDHQLVEDRIINEALKFLIDQQKQDGSFRELGNIVHKDMQSGPHSPLTITAQVLITLMEVPVAQKNQDLLRAQNRAKQYLERNYINIGLAPYPLSMVAYALTLCGSSLAPAARQAFERLAVIDGEFMYWHKDTVGASLYSDEFLPPYLMGPSLDIEMTSYALLMKARLGIESHVTPITRWLVSKQNELEGYASSQDTVIAVEALSAAATMFGKTYQHLSISMVHTGASGFEISQNITNEKCLTYTTFSVPEVNGELMVVAQGLGLGVVHMSVCYNIPTTPYEVVPFQCTTTQNSTSTDEAFLHYCCSLKEGVRSSTGMFLMVANLMDGFTADLEYIKELNKPAKLVQLDERKLNFYFDQLRPEKPVCVNIEMMRYKDVAETKPATLEALEYYKPEKRFTSQYQIDELSRTQVCDVCGSDCEGCPAPILSDWKPFTPCVEFCKPEMSVSVRECYDPSLKRIVDVKKCGLTEQPMRTRVCPKPFTCPTVSEGLWYDLPAHFPLCQTKRACSLQTENKVLKSPTSVVPGAILDGVRDHLLCTDPKLVTINPEAGFTISLLINPTAYKSFGPATFLSIGKDGEDTIVLFEKQSWNNEIRLDINVETTKYAVKQIPAEDLPIGRWSHVIITWSKEGGAKVYINGREVGVSETRKLPVYQHYTENLKFYLGKNSYGLGHPWKEGFFSGKIAALNFWPAKLPLPQIEAVAQFYNIIVMHREEQLLSIRHLRHFSPLTLGRCFRQPSTLSSVYSGESGRCSALRPQLPRLFQ